MYSDSTAALVDAESRAWSRVARCAAGTRGGAGDGRERCDTVYTEG
jgi:hypothetical protein